MRRTPRVRPLATLVVAALTAAAAAGVLVPVLATVPAEGAIGVPRATVPAAGGAAARGGARQRAARRVLARAERLLTGPAVDPRRTTANATTTDLTPLLHELFLARRYLSGPERRQARDLLARPTDGASDPYGDGYVTGSRELCGPHVCVHYVPTGNDRPRSLHWVRVTLRVMEHTWAFEVDKLGYHPPLTDGVRGGDSRFDVYLADVGSKGYYGYCAAEAYAPFNPRLASGYCVLDNDFARWQFHTRPLSALRVTAGHEFFHAIQYGYRVGQDRWLAEATATWMEDQIADGINDNRQFVPYGQLGHPSQPLDVFGLQRYNEYGNWVFFAYLSRRFGRSIVKQIWEESSARRGGPALDSVDAIAAALRARHHSFTGVYAAFAAAALTPAAALPEGRFYRPAPVAVVRALGARHRRTHPVRLTVRHLSAKTVRLRPRPGTRGRLRIAVRLPAATGSPAARVTLRTRTGVVRSLPVRVGADRRGTLVAPFSADRIAWVAVTVVNASTRYRCDQDTSWACHGVPLDDAEPFVVRARLLTLAG